jgi:hypothetical protein
MATNVFHDSRRTVPKDDPQVLSQPFDKQDQGASKAALPKLTKNSLSIVHVGKK